jgi:hypothetical protein
MGRYRPVLLEPTGCRMLLFVLIPIAWLGISVLVLAICRMAAHTDATTSVRAPRRAGRRRPAYSPRRPSTCGTVRSRIFTSVHNDQLAT